jgi:sugar phosphate isomerase/epimerase
MSDQHVPRRTFLTLTAASAAGAVLGISPPEPLSVLTPWPPLPSGEGERTTSPLSGTERGSGGEDPKAGQGVRLGVASYSLRKFSRARAIEMVKALGTPYINLKSVHLRYELAPEELAAARREVEAAGLEIVGGGTITFERDTDEDVRKFFAYAQAAGMPRIVATADPRILPRIERFAQQYDIEVAIHNHGPEDKRYPSPYDVLKHVRNMDRRMGLCIDVGHTARTGTDVVQAIADAGPRLLDMHVKDLRELKVKESQCVVGEGAIPIAEIFQQLQAIRYRGYVNLEYEIDADDPLAGMQRSFAYMRGVLAGLAAAGRPTKAAG